LEKEPAVIAEAVRAVLLVAVVLGVVTLDEKALGAVLLALSAILTLFVRQSVTPNSRLP
jgi:energy-converting hydrogenase Eha subunit A